MDIMNYEFSTHEGGSYGESLAQRKFYILTSGICFLWSYALLP